MKDKRDLAEEAFIDYDFGEGLQVIHHNGWAFDGNVLTKDVFMEYPGDRPEDDTHKAVFSCRFDSEGNLVEVSAVCGETGRPIGQTDSRQGSLVIHSESERGFWSNEDGWGDLASATIFTEAERNLTIPASSSGDAKWVNLGEAMKVFECPNVDEELLCDLVYDLAINESLPAINSTDDRGEIEDLFSAAEEKASRINNAGTDGQLHYVIAAGAGSQIATCVKKPAQCGERPAIGAVVGSGIMLRINAPKLFQRPDFIAWLNDASVCKSTWHKAGEPIGEFSDVMVAIDPSLTGEGTDSDMPGHDEVVELVRKSVRPGQTDHHIVVWLSPIE